MEDRFREYIDWIIEHRNEETQEYKSPRVLIYKAGGYKNVDEMTPEEYREYNLGRWWRDVSKERKIIEQYKGIDIKEIPEEYRRIVKQYRDTIECYKKFKVGMVPKSNFKLYIKWIKEHKDEKTGEYIKPRTTINKNGKVIRRKDLTEEELTEVRAAGWWYSNPDERIILEKYKDINEDEFMQLPQKVKNIILICNKYGIQPECKIVKQIRGYVREYVESNEELRNECNEKIEEFNREENVEL